MNLWEPILAMIMALTSFTIKPDPKAPGGDAVLAYAVDDADAMVHLDWKPTVIDNYPVMTKLADDPLVKQSPELAATLRQAVAQVEGGRAMVKNLVGIDLTTDVTSVTAFARMRAGGAPDVVVVARGKFAADLPQRLAAPTGGKTEVIDGRTAGVLPDGSLIGLTKGGDLVAGNHDLVAARLADGWKPAPRTKGSPWAQIAAALDERPFLVLASKPAPATLAAATAAMPASFGRDLLANHTLAIVSLSATGIGWVYQARDAAFAARVKTSSEGLIDLMRAAHIAPRAVIAMALAALPSYAGRSPAIDDAIKHKDQLAAAVAELTGDGKFTASVTQKGTLVVVTTRGRRLSDVVPVGLVLGFGAIGYMTAGKASAAAPAPALPARPIPARPTRPTTTPRPSTTPRPASGHP